MTLQIFSVVIFLFSCKFGSPIAKVESTSASTLTIHTPLLQQVFQRDAKNRGNVLVSGSVDSRASLVEAKVVSNPGHQTIVDWTKIAEGSEIKSGKFQNRLSVPAGGWYSLELRSRSSSGLTSETTLGKFGVGEVFIAAGQSNSTNHGSKKRTVSDNRIVAFDGTKWALADDPQPLVADGSGGGSPWPPMANKLIKSINVPIGILSVGKGGTRVIEWQPGGPLYEGLKKHLVLFGLNGVRAVLWHQGESDAQIHTKSIDYKNQLTALIQSSRRDARYALTWFVATASYLPENSLPDMIAIKEAQAQVVDRQTIFAGPNTDDLRTGYRSKDKIHMNEAGLDAHGERWADILEAFLNKK